MEHDFFIGEPMDLEFKDLRVRRGTWVNSLTLSYQFYAVTTAGAVGAAIVDLTGSVSWENTDGDYYARIGQSDTIDAGLAAGTAYFLRIYGSSGATAVNRYLKVRAKLRAET